MGRKRRLEGGAIADEESAAAEGSTEAGVGERGGRAAIAEREVERSGIGEQDGALRAALLCSPRSEYDGRCRLPAELLDGVRQVGTAVELADPLGDGARILLLREAEEVPWAIDNGCHERAEVDRENDGRPVGERADPAVGTLAAERCDDDGAGGGVDQLRGWRSRGRPRFGGGATAGEQEQTGDEPCEGGRNAPVTGQSGGPHRYRLHLCERGRLQCV